MCLNQKFTVFTYSRGCNYKPELRCPFFNAQKDEKKTCYYI